MFVPGEEPVYDADSAYVEFRYYERLSEEKLTQLKAVGLFEFMVYPLQSLKQVRRNKELKAEAETFMERAGQFWALRREILLEQFATQGLQYA